MAYLLTFCITSIVGITGWAFTLQGKVNTNEKLADQRFTDLKELIGVQFKAVNERLDRIDRSINGGAKE